MACGGGRVLACLAVSVWLLAGASAFPFTYPSAFPFSSTPVPAATEYRTTPATSTPPTSTPVTSTPPPSNFQGTPSGGQGNGGGEVGIAGGKVWCIAKPAADEQMLLANIAYACMEGGLDCAAIQPGGACFSPKNLISHASFVMNMYYQKNQRNWWTCHFNHTGLVVFADPSFGDCIYSPQ